MFNLYPVFKIQPLMNDQILEIIRAKKDSSWWLKSEKVVTSKYGSIFHLSNLENLTKENFLSFLLIKNNLHWEGIHHSQESVTSDLKKLKQTLIFLLDESNGLTDRLNNLSPKKGKYYIKGLGKAIITPILLVVYPDKYGVWNKKSEDGLKKLGLFPKFQRGNSFGEKYDEINNVLGSLAKKYSISLWQLDGVLGEIAGNGPFNIVVDDIEYGKQKEIQVISQEIRYCKYCGERIAADSIFCCFCGRKIISTRNGKTLTLNTREEFLKCAEFVNKYYRQGDKGFLYYKKIIDFHKKYGDINKLLGNDDFFETLYKTLKAWNMNQRGARLKTLTDIKHSILNLKRDICELYDYELSTLRESQLEKILNKLKKIFFNLQPMQSKTQIVGTSKLMHFLLPNLVMPIDRTYTLKFLSPNSNSWKDINAEFDEFEKVFITFYKLAKRFNLTAHDTNDQTWNTSVPKIIDNAIIGVQKFKNKEK